MNAGHGTNTPRTRLVEFNEFLDEPFDSHDVPQEPTLDLHIRLDMRDFHWAVESTNVAANYYVVCQTSKNNHSAHYLKPRR